MGTSPNGIGYTIGQQAGETNVTLNTTQMASHTHTVNANTGANANAPNASVVPGGGTVSAYGTSAGGATMNNGIVDRPGQSAPLQYPAIPGSEFLYCDPGHFSVEKLRRKIHMSDQFLAEIRIFPLISPPGMGPV